MWPVFIDAAVLFVIYLAYAYCYLRGKDEAFTSYINCTCIDLLFNWLTGVAAYLHRYCWYSVYHSLSQFALYLICIR